MQATISYGPVKRTRHSVKHSGANTKANKNRVKRSINGKTLCTDRSAKEFLRAEAEYHHDRVVSERYQEPEYVLKKGKVVEINRKVVRQAVRPSQEDSWQEVNYKPFHPLSEKAVSCCAKGSAGTKDSRVSQIVRSIDVDNVSESKGIIPLGKAERKMPPRSVKQRPAFEKAMNAADALAGRSPRYKKDD